MTDAITRRVVVEGRVQGVGFRESMRQEAERLGVTGWVRNRREGTVEALLHGPTPAVEALVAWAGHGPPGARVTALHVEPAEGAFATFEHRGTV